MEIRKTPVFCRATVLPRGGKISPCLPLVLPLQGSSEKRYTQWGNEARALRDPVSFVQGGGCAAAFLLKMGDF